jgi:hypothetical protein
MKSPVSEPVVVEVSDLSYQVFEAGSVVTATVVVEAVLGLLTESKVAVKEASP